MLKPQIETPNLSPRLLGQKIQYSPDSHALCISFTHNSAPTRRRRKAGVGSYLPFIPAPAASLIATLYPPKSVELRRTYVCQLGLIRDEQDMVYLGSGLDHHALYPVERESQSRGTLLAKPEMGDLVREA